ncbi:MAG: acyltransferase family protein [Oligoflexales bacterium]
MKSQTYQAEIDGLRALAIFIVVFFHLGFETFQGGYVGVDVFFVISGYLITRSIVKEYLQTSSFNFKNFYIRRFRRLFPALFFTLFITQLFAILVFSPQHLQRLSAVVIHAVFSLSNFYFWSESGYFELGNSFKPILHTWSLSIEEQFYLFWPICLTFVYEKCKTKGTLLFIILIGILSLALNLLFSDGVNLSTDGWFSSIAEYVNNNQSTIFFLFPFRIFEFAIGASLVWLEKYSPKNNYLKETVFILGIEMILFSAFTYNSSTFFPSAHALVPCLGTALVIASANSQYCGFLLRNRISVYIGKISYSFYLTHWPIIVFYLYFKTNSERLNLSEQLLLLTLSIGFSALVYRYIETPFRHRIGSSNPLFTKNLTLVWLTLIVLLISTSTIIYINNGWYWRIPSNIPQSISNKINEPMKLHIRHFGGMNLEKFNASLRSHTKKIALIGDSHISQYTKILAKRSNYDRGFVGFYSNGCFFTSILTSKANQNECLTTVKQGYISSLKSSEIEWIFVGFRWPKYHLHKANLQGLTQNIEDMKMDEFYNHILDDFIKIKQIYGPEKKLVFVGNVPNRTTKCYDRPQYFSYCKKPVDTPTNSFNKFAEIYLKRIGYHFINPSSILCQPTCLDEINGYPIYSDDNHLTTWGSALVVEKIMKEISAH